MVQHAHMGLSFKFDRQEIIEKVTENRDQHKRDYKTAHKGYLLEIQEQATKIAAEATKTAKQADKNRVPSKTMWSIQARQPENHEEDYDRVLDMLELAIDSEIVLDEESFRQYIRDEWDWKQAFTATNQFYSSKFNLPGAGA